MFRGISYGATVITDQKVYSKGNLWSKYLNQFPSTKDDSDLTKAKVIKLSNGIKVLMLTDKELPIARIEIIFKGGTIYDPVQKVGLAELTGKMLRFGGTKSYRPSELDKRLENIGATISTSINKEYGVLIGNSLSKDLDQLIDYSKEVLFQPRFDKKRFKIAKSNIIESIKDQQDDSQFLAIQQLKKELYNNSPYSYYPSEDSIGHIKINDLKAIWHEFIQPSNLLIGVSGNFDIGKLQKKLDDTFGLIADNTPPKLTYIKSKIDDEPAGRKYQKLSLVGINKPQAVIRLGMIAGKKNDKDYHSWLLLDNILGGNSFSSRLTKKIRVEEGLAYSVWSYYNGGRNVNGYFILGMSTQTANVKKSLQLIFDELAIIREEPVSPDELQLAKDSIVNSFILNFDRVEKLLKQWLILDYYDYDDSYLLNFRNNIEEVTSSQINTIAKRLLSKENFKVVIAGEEKKLIPLISGFGDIDIVKMNEVD